MKKLIVLAIVLLSSGLAQLTAQEETKIERAKFGIGTTFFNYNDLIESDFDIPLPRMILTIDALEKFRIEPSLGFLRTDDDTFYNIGLGLYGKIMKPKYNLLYGIKGSYSSNTFDNPDEVITFGPAIGGEYFFIPQFSLGSEISIKVL